MVIMETKSNTNNEIQFVYVGHNYQELNQAICGIQNEGINKDVPILFIKMIKINVRLSCLKVVVLIPNVERLSTQP